MEPAKIDWNNIQSIFVRDDLYEHINAPKFVDFSAPGDDSVDDEAWFCKPDCRHPKTAEDFLLASTLNSKLKHAKSAISSEIIPPLGDRNCRDANLKRRLVISSSSMPLNSEAKQKIQEDRENENPNLHTPPFATDHQRKQVKAGIKSSSEKKKPLNNNNNPTATTTTTTNSSSEDHLHNQPQLKNALSARNLGKEIFNQITEICSELKKLTLKSEEKDNSEKLISESMAKNPLIIHSAEASDMEKEEEKKKKKKKPKPLQETEKKREEISIGVKKVNVMPVQQRGEEGLVLQVRTNPPSPQCFSAPRKPLRALRTTTALNPCTPSERGVLQEVEQSNRWESGEKGNSHRNISLAGTTEARSLDMFWFLKPCTFLAK